MSDSVKIALFSPIIKYTQADRDGLPEANRETPEQTRAAFTVHVLRLLVTSKFQAGMDGKDGKVWAPFLEAFSEEPLATEITVSRQAFDWLYRIVTDPEIKIPFSGIAHWRAAVESYFEDLRAELKGAKAD